jgi:hypothetical protein
LRIFFRGSEACSEEAAAIARYDPNSPALFALRKSAARIQLRTATKTGLYLVHAQLLAGVTTGRPAEFIRWQSVAAYCEAFGHGG